MFPFGDNLRKDSRPWAIVVFLFVLAAIHAPTMLDPELSQTLLQDLGFVPVWFSLHPWANLHRLATSVFLHGDVFHLAGNALFLWVFGRSLERLLGHLVFLVAFPLLGSFGLLLHWVIFPQSGIAVIGASGAVATLMGAYLALFPTARIKIFVFIGSFGAPLKAPAWVFLFYWIGFEIASLVSGDAKPSGVAYAVHVGGFLVGAMGAVVWKVAYPFADEQLQEFLATAMSTTNTPSKIEASCHGIPQEFFWQILREGTEYGPFDVEAFQGLVERKELLATDYVWHTGLVEWVPAFAYVKGVATS